jgi:hypothetical protein
MIKQVNMIKSLSAKKGIKVSYRKPEEHSRKIKYLSYIAIHRTYLLLFPVLNNQSSSIWKKELLQSKDIYK